ncbi:helix-turn-helix domain-containing protein [Bacillota bacterium Meth-B3]|nr:helix-turn-helix transcriptional regulator [Christensenellaceae bacterium]MEA5069066.1 helix-turn-helix transcriptional regulator [Christensenellaceae bacterium]
MDIYTELGARVRTLRKARRWTQTELAGKAGISVSFLGHIERGTRKLSIETLARLAFALDAPIDRLMPTFCHGTPVPVYDHGDILRALAPLHALLGVKAGPAQ